MTTTTARHEEREERTESPATSRYVSDLARLHGTLRYGGLLAAIEGPPICRIEGLGDGLTTVSVWERQLPERYLQALLGFRLSQFLQTGLMDRELVHRRALFHEPLPGPARGVETIHTITLTGEGRIVGYLGLVGSADPEPLPLDSPVRSRFPVEIAHRVELLSGYAAPGLTTHNAFEIKRFVRDALLPHGEQRNRVPWHLILACMKVGGTLDQIKLVVGDAGERGALRHLRLVGFDPRVVEGTTPWLPRSELMWISYELPVEKRAKPFAALVPGNLAELDELIEAMVAGGGAGCRQALVSGLGGAASLRG
jgi:hypothetical protein